MLVSTRQKTNVWGRGKTPEEHKNDKDNHNGYSCCAEREVLTLVFNPLSVSFTPPGSRQHRDNSPACPHKMLIFWCPK